MNYSFNLNLVSLPSFGSLFGTNKNLKQIHYSRMDPISFLQKKIFSIKVSFFFNHALLRRKVLMSIIVFGLKHFPTCRLFCNKTLMFNMLIQHNPNWEKVNNPSKAPSFLLLLLFSPSIYSFPSISVFIPISFYLP